MIKWFERRAEGSRDLRVVVRRRHRNAHLRSEICGWRWESWGGMRQVSSCIAQGSREWPTVAVATSGKSGTIKCGGYAIADRIRLRLLPRQDLVSELLIS
jgi:hypothetical protein